MIAIDTNVLLRYLLSDDVVQSKQAARLIKGNWRVLVTDAVLVETVWTLAGRKYQLKKKEIVKTILHLFHEPSIVFENGPVVWKALNTYKKAKAVKGKEAGFADALIVCKSRNIIEKMNEEFAGVYSFDKAAQQFDDVKKP
ncbi:PIN domain-containing protein [Endozoicomonas sp. SESOKO1]|uniref:PIN domain-containing protein n=1 Tax=Endozoicomonas sp. SESOKO1 TaxID=2828742 RepID=UPI002147E08E|nr:type II toxin-antitoxin system VapC family toxin [Endozoicomonas sp. SESOKO1]